MILNEYVEIVINKGNINLYKKLGFLAEVSESIKYPVALLTKGSSCIVTTKCGHCGDAFNIKYKKYHQNKSRGKDNYCSRACFHKKNNERILDEYGVKNITQIPLIKEKIKQTNLRKYNSEYYIGSKEGTDRRKTKLVEKYGVDNPLKLDHIKEKVKKTNLEKYGTEYVLQSKDIRNKIKKTNLEKYGFGSASQSPLIKDKIIKSNIERWGHPCPLQNEEIQKKSKDTLFENYSVVNPLKSIEISKKVDDTNILKYGARRSIMLDSFKELRNNNNIEKYGENTPSKNELFRTKFKICNHEDYIKYIDNKISLFKCLKGHNFEIHTDNFFSRTKINTPLCTVCNPIGDSSSIKEKDLYEYIRSVYDGEIITSYRDKLEIDIYLPELNLGFEFNGLYWHSEVYREKNYHLDKTNYFKERGIRIIHVWEDDWDFKNNIVKSQIKNWLGLTKNKIYARNCEVKEINYNKEIKEFLNTNHIQGWVGSNIKLGLYFKNELVAIMIFDTFEGRKKMGQNEWNLSRFCNKLNTNVIGGASKLLAYFKETYNPVRIVSYADKTWSDGNMYYKLGFEFIDETKADYKYIVEGKRIHKSRFKKSGIETDLFSRIFDCGKAKFEYR